jgi:hypothetical protein
MRKLIETGKCSSCGDYTEIYEYNRSKSCAACLGMDRRGVTRHTILNRNISKDNERKPRIRKDRN